MLFLLREVVVVCLLLLKKIESVGNIKKELESMPPNSNTRFGGVDFVIMGCWLLGLSVFCINIIHLNMFYVHCLFL